MPYLIVTYDKPGHEHVRDRTRAAHFAFLEANVHKVIAGGGFLNEAATSIIGGMMIIDVDSRAEAQAFIEQDPFTHAELFERVEITRWRPAFFEFKRVQPDQLTKKSTS